jgi:hypothetical protein
VPQIRVSDGTWHKVLLEAFARDADRMVCVEREATPVDVHV